MIFFRFCTSTCKNLIVFSFNTSRPLWVHSLHFFHISLFLQPELRMSRGQIIQNMGQLNDVEFCNNLLFLLNQSPESIAARSNDSSQKWINFDLSIRSILIIVRGRVWQEFGMCGVSPKVLGYYLNDSFKWLTFNVFGLIYFTFISTVNL